MNETKRAQLRRLLAQPQLPGRLLSELRRLPATDAELARRTGARVEDVQAVMRWFESEGWVTCETDTEGE